MNFLKPYKFQLPAEMLPELQRLIQTEIILEEDTVRSAICLRIHYRLAESLLKNSLAQGDSLKLKLDPAEALCLAGILPKSNNYYLLGLPQYLALQSWCADYSSSLRIKQHRLLEACETNPETDNQHEIFC